ncbi:MAG: hypothetical protein Q7S21_01040 [archaeon]|nr:hypothetical protein [archaeon]
MFLKRKKPEKKHFTKNRYFFNDRAITEVENKTKRLVYADDFKQFVRKSPGIIKDFLNTRKRLIADKDKTVIFEKGGKVIVERIHGIGIKHAFLFKLTIGNKCFFIKEYHPSFLIRLFKGKKNVHLGPKQFLASAKAKSAIESLGEKIVNFNIGFNDEKKSFFVSDFYESLTPFTFDLKRQLGEEKFRELTNRINMVEKVLEKISIGDVHFDNCFYDEKNDQLIFFDIATID